MPQLCYNINSNVYGGKIMQTTLKNDRLTVVSDTNGAELHSVKSDGIEYLWQAGSAWNRHAPILFPFICSPANKEYFADGKKYVMPANHGFARDSVFEIAEKGDGFVTYKLAYSEKTLAVYPYKFEFFVSYKLDGNKVTVSHKVVNADEKAMYFYVGGHPAFNCPLTEGTSFNDWYVEYEKNENIVQPIPDGERTVLNGEKILKLSRELFDFDVIMKDQPNSKNISLKSEKSKHGVTLHYPQSECIAVWSTTANDDAKFVCLEPWTSVPVYADDDQPDIEKKAHAIRLESGKTYTYEYTIEVF